MMRSLCFVLAAGGVLLAASPSNAQVARPGWIGISFEFQAAGDREGVTTTRAIVTDVSPAGPAIRAGIRPGDVLMSINEIAGPDSLANLGRYLRLEVGDSVVMVVRRDGVTHTVRVAAEERADGGRIGTRLAITFQPDSMVESMFRAMDSLRVRLVQESGQARVLAGAGDGRVTVLRSPDEPRVRPAPQVAPRVASGDGWSVLELREPFEGRLFGGERYDSLLAEMNTLNSAIREVRAQEGERLRVLSARGDVRRRTAETDPELLSLKSRLEELSSRSLRLKRAMEDAVWTEAGAAFAGRGFSDERTDVAPRVGVFSPLTPYVLGQNRAAGAEVIDLTPGLAEYFEVDGGVLVVDVPEGTLADVAGIEAGDVITRIDQVTIRSVQDLRLGLSRAGNDIPITLIRQGASRQVLLRR